MMLGAALFLSGMAAAGFASRSPDKAPAPLAVPSQSLEGGACSSEVLAGRALSEVFAGLAPAPVRAERLSPKDRTRVFEKVWREIAARYYDPTFHGVNWEEVQRRYKPLVEAAKNDDEFYDLLKRMTAELHDAHTRFSTPDEWRILKKHEGVSLGFAVDEIDGKTVVSYVRPDSAAARAGVAPGMIVLSLDGQPIAGRIAEARTKQLPSSSDRADRLHLYRAVFGGPPNTTVKVSLQRADGTTFETSITRRIYLNPPAVEARLLPSGDAYLRFDGFDRAITKEFKEALEKFRNAPGVIIDLRRNGGGNLGVLLPIAGYFFKQKTPFAKDATRTGKPLSQFGGLFKLGLELYAGKAGEQIYAGPVVILVRGRTASAAEIFAGGMQETGRAKIVGSQTCGCVVGIVKPRPVKGGGVLEIGEILWLTPKGRKLEGQGVIPDKTVAPTIADLQKGRDPVLEEAEKTLRGLATTKPAAPQR